MHSTQATCKVTNTVFVMWCHAVRHMCQPFKETCCLPSWRSTLMTQAAGCSAPSVLIHHTTQNHISSHPPRHTESHQFSSTTPHRITSVLMHHTTQNHISSHPPHHKESHQFSSTTPHRITTQKTSDFRVTKARSSNSQYAGWLRNVNISVELNFVKYSDKGTLCVVSGFHKSVNETFVLLACYAALIGG
jgi:hypothetical protein